MEVRTIKICDIKVKDRARLDKGDIDELAASIAAKGLIQPITVNENLRLLAGERRLLAHIQLGLETIEAVIRSGSDIIDAFEIELIENAQRKDMTWVEICNLQMRIFNEKSRKGKWSQSKQAEMLSSSQPQISRQIQMAEALELLPELGHRPSFDEAWKELKTLEEDVHIEVLRQKSQENPAIRQAAKWATDHYKVGDALAGMSGIYAEAAHFAEVDPPYGIDLNTRKSRNADQEDLGEYNEIDADEYETFYERIASEVFRILKPDSFAVFWYGWDWHNEVRSILINNGFAVPTVPAVWTKGRSGQTASPDTTLGSCHEPFWLARKGKPKLVIPGRGNVFDYSPVAPSSKIHPTERPIGLMEEILRICCFPGSVIVVPFLGSGVTLRAAYKTGHTGFGWDLSELHKAKFLRKVTEDKDNGNEGNNPE